MSGELYHPHTPTSWGRILRAPHPVARPRFRAEAVAAFDARPPEGGVLGVGLGRSYGDSGLNPGGALIDMSGLDRLMAFDATAGVLRAEAGASLSALLAFLAPRGWFLPTTPGSRFVTLGGAIANDVHGKNHHHAGAFGRHVRRIGLLRSDGYIEISREHHSALLAATIGGLGLTGLILWAELELAAIPSSELEQETLPFHDLGAFFDLAEASEAAFEHTVAWIDCTSARGRGLFTRGNWARGGARAAHDDARGPTLPVDAPGFALNPLTLRAFNTLYFAHGRRQRGLRRTPYWRAFYPLDAVKQWNRLYGPRGFYQYQSVVPRSVAREATAAMLCEIARSGQGSFLAVLKTFGPLTSPGLLSFPMEGATLALDFADKGPETLRLFERLDAIVAEAGGRLYPAKDGRMSAAMFQRGYPLWERFARFVDPACSSAFWRRVSACARA